MRRRREAPRSEALVHQNGVGVGSRKRALGRVRQHRHLVAGQRRADEVAAVSERAVDGAQPPVRVRRHDDVVLDEQRQLGVGVVPRPPRVDPLAHDARRPRLKPDPRAGIH